MIASIIVVEAVIGSDGGRIWETALAAAFGLGFAVDPRDQVAATAAPIAVAVQAPRGHAATARSSCALIFSRGGIQKVGAWGRRGACLSQTYHA